MLVANVVLGAGNHTRVLDALDSARRSLTSQVRVDCKTLPVATSQGHATKGSQGRTKKDVDTLLAALGAQQGATVIEKVTAPGGACGDAGGEGAVVVAESDTQRTVLHTEAVETEARYTANVTNADVALPAVVLGQPFGFSASSSSCIERGISGQLHGGQTHPTPVVRLTFSMRVSWETKSLALAYASSHPGALGFIHGEG